MTQYLSQQKLLYLLAGALVLGYFAGAVYQIFLIRRAAFEKMKIFRPVSVIWLNVEDFLFLIALGAFVTVLFYAAVGGVFRLMAIPVLCLGLLCWRITLGRLIDGVTDWILRLMAALAEWIYAAWLRPVGRRIKALLLGLWKCWADLHARRQKKKIWKQAEIATARYVDWLEQVLQAEGRLPDGKMKTKER